MTALFDIGIILLLLSLVLQIMLNGKMRRNRKEYERLPLKMDEIRADYRRKRFLLFLFQIACLALAILGLFLG